MMLFNNIIRLLLFPLKNINLFCLPSGPTFKNGVRSGMEDKDKQQQPQLDE